MNILEVQDLCKTYGTGETAVDPLGFLSRPHRGHGLSFIRGYCEVILRL